MIIEKGISAIVELTNLLFNKLINHDQPFNLV
jgi:hypothetical protein